VKVLFDYSIFFHQQHGGISRYFLNLYKEFIQKEIDTKILAPLHNNTFLKDSNYKSNLNLYIKKYPKNTRKIFKFYNQTLTSFYVNLYKPEILHKTFYEKNLNKNKKVKKILTVMDLAHEIYYKDYGFNENFKHKKLAIQNLDFVICPSNKTKNDFLSYYDFPEENIEVVYMGVEQFKNCNIDNIKVIDFPFLLYVGSRDKYKNFISLVKAYSISNNLKKDFKIVCFGGGKFNKEELNLFKKLNLDINSIIQINGDDNQLLYLYKKASAFIFPSIIEGLGLPPLEAMSQGCPVISSNHPAILEGVANAAETFDPIHIEDIMQKIERVLYDKTYTKTLIKKGIERSKLFSWKRCADETLDVYKKVYSK
jgi:glycosyltransferase involved in cell wall biosynthesis